MSFLFTVLIISLFSLPDACHASEKLPVTVTILPQAYFVERLGGNHVDAKVMIPKGANPETYEPAPQQLISLSRAKIYVMIGGKAFPAEGKFLSLLGGRKGIEIVGFDVETGDTDPHLWISIPRVKKLAEKIAPALSRLDPLHSSDYKDNFSHFLRDIDRTRDEIGELLSGKKGKTFIADHPAWSYFAAEFGLSQITIEEEGKPVNAAHLKEIVRFAKAKSISVIFTQKGFDSRSARTVAREINARIVETDPLEKEWLMNLKNFAALLRKCI